MYRPVMLALSVTALAACSTAPPAAQESEPQTHQSESDGGQSASEDKVAAVGDINQAAAASEPGITDMPPRGDEVICVRERRTGSNRAKKVCRTRAEIERDRIEGKETFEGMRQAQEHIEQ